MHRCNNIPRHIFSLLHWQRRSSLLLRALTFRAFHHLGTFCSRELSLICMRADKNTTNHNTITHTLMQGLTYLLIHLLSLLGDVLGLFQLLFKHLKAFIIYDCSIFHSSTSSTIACGQKSKKKLEKSVAAWLNYYALLLPGVN